LTLLTRLGGRTQLKALSYLIRYQVTHAKDITIAVVTAMVKAKVELAIVPC